MHIQKVTGTTQIGDYRDLPERLFIIKDGSVTYFLTLTKAEIRAIQQIYDALKNQVFVSRFDSVITTVQTLTGGKYNLREYKHIVKTALDYEDDA